MSVWVILFYAQKARLPPVASQRTHPAPESRPEAVGLVHNKHSRVLFAPHTRYDYHYWHVASVQ